MKPGFVTPITLLLSFALIIAGSYLVIDNLLTPSGLMFEGIMAVSLGIIMFLASVVVTTLDKTVEVFSEIFEQQVEIQERLIDVAKGSSMPGPGMFPGMFPGGMTITDMDTGETKKMDLPGGEDAMKKMQDMIMGAMKHSMQKGSGKKKSKKLEDMNLQELETALASAISTDNFEEATKIKKLIEALKAGPDSDSPESDEKK